MSTAPFSQALHLNPLHFRLITLHKIASVHPSSLHFTSLHLFTLTTHLNSLACNYILTLFLKVFSLQGKDAIRLAGNWLQFVMVLFTKEYLPTSVLCFLVLILCFLVLILCFLVLILCFLVLIITLFLYDNFNIPYVTQVVSCFHYSNQNNALISHFSIRGTSPPISSFLSLLY